uniref:Bm2414 n=1 Tax=Brugia malayi TaxID=6279 RepID=A0A1I9GDC2_BRUMA|nr:Bm2414 [Brugia malayi]
MPCCYLLPFVPSVYILLLSYYQLVTTQQHFEQHALPTDHIVVHSSSSNVSITDWVVVISDESKVEFQEKFLHGKVWSRNSRLDFQPHGQTEKFSGYNNVLSIFELSQILLRANRSTDGHSYMEYRADKKVNLIFSNGITEVNAINGQWAHVSAVTWQLPVAGQITIGSNILNGLNRQLHIVSVSSNYNINMTIFNAQMKMRYGNITVQITPDYRFLRIRSGLYMVNLKTIVSPFEILVSDHEMIVQCENERAIVQMLPNSSNIIISTDQYSRVVIDRGREAVVVEGREIRPAGNVNLLSMQLRILLKSGNTSSIHASTNRSQITVQTTSTNMASTASHHAVDITGGKINLQVFTGNVSVDVVANNHLESLPTMLTPFLTPQDHFQDTTLNNFDHNFPTDERDNNSNKTVLATQIPFIMANVSSDFQTGVAATTDRHIYESIPESAFMTPLLPQLTLIFPESSSTILTRNKTSTSSSSTESTALSYSENTSLTSFIAEATETEQIGTWTNVPSWPKVLETTMTSIISLDTSTVASSGTLSTLRTISSSSSFTLTAMLSSLLSSSLVTIVPTIPLIPIKTLITNRTAEVIISSMPVPITSHIPQSVINASTASNPGDVTEIVVSEKEYPNDENRDYVQTEFIEFSWGNVAGNSVPITMPTTMIATTTHTDALLSLTPQKMGTTTKCIEIEPSELQNTPFFTKEPTVMNTSEKPIVVKTNRSIGSAWTPFVSLPFEFPPTAHYPSTVSFRKDNFILQDSEAKSEITFDANEISKHKEWNKSALEVPSIPMITFLKEIFDKIIQHDSATKKESQNGHENPETEFEQQNFFSTSKFKRALSSFENEEHYELQLKIPLGINLTAVELNHKLLLALKKFVLFTDLNEGRLPISEDAVQIKITNMERNGEHLKVLYSVSINAKISSDKLVINLLMIIIIIINNDNNNNDNSNKEINNNK